jgi:hypothetical protein
LNINPFIQTAFGAIVGGLVVIATSWFNTMREKRKEVQAWFEQRYVTEGIDPLLTYFSNLTLQLMQMPDGKTIPLPDATVPIEALTRIEILLGIKGGMEFLSVFIGKVNASLQLTEKDRDDAIIPLFELCRLLYKLRQEVLKLIPREIRHKNQQLNITELSDSISFHVLEYCGGIDELMESLQSKKEQTI